MRYGSAHDDAVVHRGRCVACRNPLETKHIARDAGEAGHTVDVGPGSGALGLLVPKSRA